MQAVGQRASDALAAQAAVNEHVQRIQAKKKFVEETNEDHLRKLTALELSGLPAHQHQVFKRQFGLISPYKIDPVTGRSKRPLPGMQGAWSPVAVAPYSEGYAQNTRGWLTSSGVLGSRQGS